MSDEPVEDGDAESDAEGASSSNGSDEPDAPDESSPDEYSSVDYPPEYDVSEDAPHEDAPSEDVSPEDASSTDAPTDGSAPDGDADAADREDDAGEPDRQDGAAEPDHDGDADGDGAPDEEPTDTDDGGFDFVDDAREAVTASGEEVEESDSSATPASSGRPGYTDDHVTASGDESETDEGAETGDDASETDPADHAPIGTQAPSPDEGPVTSVTDTAGAGTAGGSGGGGSSILSGGIGGTAPPDDEEMPLTEHIEEMLTRLAIVVVVASLATLAAFPFANDVIIQMWYDVHGGSVEACRPAPQSDGCVAPHVYGPLELVLTRIRVAGLVGLLVALPLAVYQIYRFMRPGLYPHERRYYLAAVPFSLVLGIVGMTFAYFVLLPLLFEYFITYTEGSADLAFQLAETMNLVLLMMGMLAIIFQIPLLIMLAIMMGITTRRWLERRRLYFWGLFLGVAVIFGPDPTGMAPFLLTATMVTLFEGTLLLLRWTGR